MAYSVLMSVYAKENAAYFSDAVESMLHQSCPPDQFVLVCDGPLTPGLDEAIQRFTASRDGGLFRVLRLPENVGLGRALQAGLPLCDHDLVARMDSDDLALPLRKEHQLALPIRSWRLWAGRSRSLPALPTTSRDTASYPHPRRRSAGARRDATP